MQVYRDLCDPHGAADAGRGSAGSAPALRPCRCRREFLRRRLGCGRRQGVGRSACAERRLAIFVGGSGLYFKALTRGLSAVPPIPPQIREGVRARLERDGVEALHAELARRDSAHRRTTEAARSHPHRARARSDRGDGAFAVRLAPRRLAAAVISREHSPRCFSSPTATHSTRGSRRVSMPCCKPARSRR